MSYTHSRCRDHELGRVARVAVNYARILIRQSQEAAYCLEHPDRTSSWSKITDRPIATDPTDRLDRVGLEAIREVLDAATHSPGHPLSGGLLMANEEEGVDHLAGCSGRTDERLIAFVDPLDGTTTARRGLDGTVLLTFYDTSTGVRAAAAADLRSDRLYWRVRGDAATALSVGSLDRSLNPFPSDPQRVRMVDPLGLPLPLSPSRRRTLEGASIGLYTGRPERLAAAAPLVQRLSEVGGIESIEGVGGALGPLRVADGKLDACLEVGKGFRPWDALPGLFIAAGAGACVLDDRGRPLPFGRIPELTRHLSEGFRGCRQKFIAAGTKQLARTLAEQALAFSGSLPLMSPGFRAALTTVNGANHIQKHALQPEG